MPESKQNYISLSYNKIRSALALEVNLLIDQLEVIYETGSTNKTIAGSSVNNYAVLLAESQTEGCGRRQKKWASPVGKNIYLSIKFHLKHSNNIHFIPLITAVSICKTLYRLGIVDCQIKWPNDIYLNAKKLGGILVESRYNMDQGHSIIIGIGLNINMTANNEIDQPWTSLLNITKKSYDRNIIVAEILSELITQLNTIEYFNKTQFIVDWDLLDYLKDKKINIIEEYRTYNAISRGIADDGALLVEISDNFLLKTKEIKKVYAADVSINTNKAHKEQS